MKYLTYFRPNEEFSDLILKQDQIVVPGSDLHSTISVFYMSEDNESDLIKELSRINFNSFCVQTEKFDDFDDDSLVLRLSKPNELSDLHRIVVSIVQNYVSDTSKFNKMIKQYGLDKYNPHLTISKSSSNFNRKNNHLFGRKMQISEYFLAKKDDGVWQEVHTFASKVRPDSDVPNSLSL